MQRRDFFKTSIAGVVGAAMAQYSRSGQSESNSPDFNSQHTLVDPKYSRSGKSALDTFRYESIFSVGTENLNGDTISVESMKAAMDKFKQKEEKSFSDLYMSPEALEDIRKWGVDQIDETTRKELFKSGPLEINHLNSVSISVSNDLESEEIWVLGRKGRYYETIKFPVELTCEIKLEEHPYYWRSIT